MSVGGSGVFSQLGTKATLTKANTLNQNTVPRTVNRNVWLRWAGPPCRCLLRQSGRERKQRKENFEVEATSECDCVPDAMLSSLQAVSTSFSTSPTTMVWTCSR